MVRSTMMRSGVLLDLGQALGPVLGKDHRMATTREDLLVQLTHHPVIVDDEDSCHQSFHASLLSSARYALAFSFAAVFFGSGVIKNAASGVSLTSGRISANTFGVTFFATVHSMSGVSSGSSSSRAQGTSIFFRCAGLSSCAAFRIAPIRSRSILTSISSSRTCFFGYRPSA